MKNKWSRYFLPVFFVLMSIGVAHAEKPAHLRILFIGNSITYTNDMPAWVAELSKDLGFNPAMETKDESRPSYRFQDQLWSDEKWAPLATIRQGGWSIVVLQGQVDEPLRTPEAFFAGAARLAEEVRSAGAEPLLFQTYAPAEGYSFYVEPWSGGSPSSMQDRISKAYAQAAEQIKARVAPIGDAYLLIITQHPEINLYDPDKLHPSACGSYLMACVLVAVITGKDPRAASWLPPGWDATEPEARVLREAAARVSLKK
jgi:hypothetical protein